MELTPRPLSLLLPTLLPFTALVLAVGGLRLIELRISRRRQRALRQRGVPQVTEPHFAVMVTLHSALLVAALLEAWLVPRAPLPLISPAALVLLVGANALRLWVISTLGPHWNVQIMDSATLGVVASGPFRFIRHPNYVAVFVELLALPLVHGAWLTAVVGAACHVWVLAHRIRVEESALLAHAEYRQVMGPKPRFFPRLLPRSR